MQCRQGDAGAASTGGGLFFPRNPNAFLPPRPPQGQEACNAGPNKWRPLLLCHSEAAYGNRPAFREGNVWKGGGEGERGRKTAGSSQGKQPLSHRKGGLLLEGGKPPEGRGFTRGREGREEQPERQTAGVSHEFTKGTNKRRGTAGRARKLQASVTAQTNSRSSPSGRSPLERVNTLRVQATD